MSEASEVFECDPSTEEGREAIRVRIREVRERLESAIEHEAVIIALGAMGQLAGALGAAMFEDLAELEKWLNMVRAMAKAARKDGMTPAVFTVEKATEH